jgi:tRNA pseudouridine38-40 synthase
VDQFFHARFSATSRTYEYHIFNRSSPTALHQHRSWWIVKPLDLEAMNQGALFFQGTHDFSGFRHKDCQSASPIKTLDLLWAEEHHHVGQRWITVHARARSFLHRQVRMMVGALVYVGLGKWAPEKIRDLLTSGQKNHHGVTAPPQGLFLTQVGYQQDPRLDHGFSP